MYSTVVYTIPYNTVLHTILPGRRTVVIAVAVSAGPGHPVSCWHLQLLLL